MFFPEIVRLSDLLLADEDDMVQKGLGWLLRETAKFDAKRTVPYLMKIRGGLRGWCCGRRVRRCRTDALEEDEIFLSSLRDLAFRLPSAEALGH